MKTTKQKSFYYLVTILMTMMFAMSGIMTLVAPPPLAQMFHELGFPDYFRVLLGVRKLVGLVFLWWPETSVKLWAYHGYTFLIRGAIYARYAIGHPFGLAIPSGMVLTLTLLSMMLWHRVLTSKLSLQKKYGNRMRSVRCILILAGMGIVSGCTMIPSYERPAAPVSSQYPGKTDTQTSLVSELSWTNFFADERLKNLIGLALTNNRDLRVAVLNVEQSRAQYRISRSELLPTVDGIGNFTRSHAAGMTSDSWSASIGTTAYEVDLWGRIRSLNSQALEKYFATVEARRSAQISLVAQVATEYFTLREAEAQLALAQKTLAAVEESYALNKATFDAGASSELDLRTAEGQVQTAKINVITYERQQAQAENYLTLLIGEPLPEIQPAPLPFESTNLLAKIPVGLPSELVLRRPDILEAEHTLKAANANIGAARAAFFPAVQITSSIGTTSSEFNKLFSSGTGLWSFSPQITLPIFTGGKNRADLDSAKISTRIEVANYEKVIQTAFREVSDALVANSSYGQQIENERLLIAAQQSRYDLADVRYRQGADSYLNVLSAQQDLYGAQQNSLQTQFQKLSAQMSLYQALGGGWK